jgi:hypothetical protein
VAAQFSKQMNSTQQNGNDKTSNNAHVVKHVGAISVGSSIRIDNEIPAKRMNVLDQPATEEVTRQIIQNIAGFFSQLAVWDAQQELERKVA